MDFTVENVCGFLIRSRLMTPEEMKNMYARWQAEGKDSAHQLTAYLRWMVTNHFVTEYQAGLLSKGHSDPNDYFLNQYRILDRLGRGRMAGVYKAQHTLGQVVAIKVLPPSKGKKQEFLARFEREAELAMQLKHPNVVRTFQIGEARGVHYIVMEYLEGETLEDVLNRRKRLPHGEAIRLMHQALNGLQHIHDRGMVHRDLKPANLMLLPAPAKGEPDNTLSATVKILDIGLGRMALEAGEEADGELTSEGMLLGTPDYLAPEQARDARSIDIRADIYSLGCVFYHCLTGQPPFPEKNLLNQLVRHATETAKPVKEFSPQVPDGVQQVLNYMMAKQPDQRYPNPDRAAQALQVFLMADAAAPKPLEESQELKLYLNSLKKGNAASPPAASPPPAAAAAPRPAAPAPAAPTAPRAAPPTPATPTPRSAPAAPPVAAPTPAAVATPPRTLPTPTPAAATLPTPTPKAKPAAKPAPASPAAAPVAAQQFDVELVPAGAMPAPAFSWAPRSLRDFLLIGYGMGFTLLVVLIIWAINALSSNGGE